MEAVGMESHVPSNPKGESWTEEKHVHFLNSMEAWFVRTMLENNDRYTLRLDRHLPDTCESTLDSKHNVHKRNNRFYRHKTKQNEAKRRAGLIKDQGDHLNRIILSKIR
ncbi:uncharacterized protein [Gossypium hirsutum]|uniref:Uncharacterized protein isoform X1 n=1 Tax=Gossypium hirsutum TaxID=3635 RepID=A0A1U8HR47_GOSHI|nr:uncharacterized protein LOC107888801 isoform X1 [Gossypium hirsutum]